MPNHGTFSWEIYSQLRLELKKNKKKVVGIREISNENDGTWLPSGKLTWQWKMDLLKMYSLLKMGIFYCHVSLLEGK